MPPASELMPLASPWMLPAVLLMSPAVLLMSPAVERMSPAVALIAPAVVLMSPAVALITPAVSLIWCADPLIVSAVLSISPAEVSIDVARPSMPRASPTIRSSLGWSGFADRRIDLAVRLVRLSWITESVAMLTPRPFCEMVVAFLLIAWAFETTRASCHAAIPAATRTTSTMMAFETRKPVTSRIQSPLDDTEPALRFPRSKTSLSVPPMPSVATLWHTRRVVVAVPSSGESSCRLSCNLLLAAAPGHRQPRPPAVDRRALGLRQLPPPRLRLGAILFGPLDPDVAKMERERSRSVTVV